MLTQLPLQTDISRSGCRLDEALLKALKRYILYLHIGPIKVYIRYLPVFLLVADDFKK